MDLGYRMQTESTTLSGSVFMVNYKNRIARAFDPATALSVDYNVGNVSVKGLELEAGQKLNKNFSLYSSLSYTESQMKQDLKASATLTEPTAGKTMPDTPKWMAAVALSFKEGPWFGQLTAKHTGKAFATLVNDEEMKAYTVMNLAAGYKFANSGFFKAPEVRMNIDNLADTKYQRISSGSGSLFTTRALGSGGRSPSYYIGAPRFVSVTLRSDF
jgi:iron complex outermembrane receptor protein